jgi:hypothetical protein
MSRKPPPPGPVNGDSVDFSGGDTRLFQIGAASVAVPGTLAGAAVISLLFSRRARGAEL